jgi:hypothetical protein
VNGARGEIEMQFGGKRYVLCLTLGALAEIETSLGCRSITELQLRMKALTAREIAGVLAALLRGGGQSGEGLDALCRNVPAGVAASAVAEAFHAALG